MTSWAPDYLATQVGVLNADPEADAVYSNATLFGNPDKEGKTYMEHVLPSDGEVSFGSLVSGKCNIIGAATMLRQTATPSVRDCTTPKSGSEKDLDLWLRVVKSGGRIVYHRRRSCG